MSLCLCAPLQDISSAAKIHTRRAKWKRGAKSEWERPPTEAASDASYQTYRDARAIRIIITTANKPICAHKLLAKLWLLLSLCIAMVMTSFQDAISNGGI
jgi:hypothetical protein